MLKKIECFIQPFKLEEVAVVLKNVSEKVSFAREKKNLIEDLKGAYAELDHLKESKANLDIKIDKIEKRKIFHLKATIWGESYDPNRHPSRKGVKAITYHRMKILKKKNKSAIKFILDV